MTKAIIPKFILPALLLLYMISLAGMFSTYFAFYHRDSFQQEVQQTSQNELKSFSFTAEEFASLKWTDGQKEFERDGKMFDVASVEKKGDTYIIYCENDFFEDVLIGLLKTGAEKTKAKAFVPLSFAQPIPDFEFSTFSVDHRPGNDFKSDLYLSSPMEKSTPPPRLG